MKPLPCLYCGRMLVFAVDHDGSMRGYVHRLEDGTAGSMYWQRCDPAYGGCGWQGSPYPPARCCPDSLDCPTNALRDGHCAQPDRS